MKRTWELSLVFTQKEPWVCGQFSHDLSLWKRMSWQLLCSALSPSKPQSAACGGLASGPGGEPFGASRLRGGALVLPLPVEPKSWPTSRARKGFMYWSGLVNRQSFKVSMVVRFQTYCISNEDLNPARLFSIQPCINFKKDVIPMR